MFLKHKNIHLIAFDYIILPMLYQFVTFSKKPAQFFPVL